MTPLKTEAERTQPETTPEAPGLRFQPIKLRGTAASDAPPHDSRYEIDYYKDEPMPESDGVNPLQIQQCCVVLEQVEKTGKKPITLEWFRDDALMHSYKFDWLESAELRQRVIDKAIEAKGIRMVPIPNMVAGDPDVPTLERVRVELPKDGQRFHPITVRGEPATVSMMRDRGRR
jgi:hypothetical protein